ncbi:MAG: protein translocase subunit SecD [Gemmatimonadota bacterium]
MFSTLRGRFLVILGAVALALGALFVHPEGEPAIKLGLDLQGGMQLALEISDPEGTMDPELKREAIDQNMFILRNRIDEFGVTEPIVQKSGDTRIIVELAGVTDEGRAKAVIERAAYLEWKLVRPTAEFSTVLQRMDRIAALHVDTMDLAAGPAAGEAAGPQADFAETFFGGDTAAAGDTAVTDTATADTAAGDTTAATAQELAAARAANRTPLSNRILGGAQDGEFLVHVDEVEAVRRLLDIADVRAALPRDAELRWGSDAVASGPDLYQPLFFLDKEPFLTGENLVEAIPGRDAQFNQTIVSFTLNRRGGNIFDRVTSQHIGDRIAIVLDSLVHSAPVVEGRIGRNGQITLNQAPLEEAQDLALVLNAGAFKAPLEIVEQRSVGPSLGAEAVQQGKIAGILGVVLVLLVMVVYYRMAGVLAVAALVLFVLFVLGGLAGFGATLSAPGIAGLILSIGMAVDANVLIFERIREELAGGRTPRAAADLGFQHAMSAIVDSNLTTLITALILFQVGTGPVRGFAVTLSIGIIASFFSAVFVTRTFFLLYLDRKRTGEALSI